MLQITAVNPSSFEPPADLTEYALSDIDSVKLAFLEMVRGSNEVWDVKYNDKTVFVAGVYAPTLVGFRPEFWLLLGKAFEAEPTRWILKARKWLKHVYHLYPVVHGHVDPAFPRARRFAKLFGFREVGTEILGDEFEYIIVEGRAEWL